jgi:hypothetical protein
MGFMHSINVVLKCFKYFQLVKGHHCRVYIYNVYRKLNRLLKGIIKYYKI